MQFDATFPQEELLHGKDIGIGDRVEIAWIENEINRGSCPKSTFPLVGNDQDIPGFNMLELHHSQIFDNGSIFFFLLLKVLAGFAVLDHII